MSTFTPRPVSTPHHFEIAENGQGYWEAQDREGLIGRRVPYSKGCAPFRTFWSGWRQRLRSGATA